MDYGPYSDSGVTTHSVSLSFGVGSSGVQGGINIGWGYTVPDIVVHNISDETSNIMEIWHDINENKDVGINTCVVEPGNVIKCSTGGDGKYHTTEEYKVTFVLLAFWKDFFSDYYINVSETID